MSAEYLTSAADAVAAWRGGSAVSRAQFARHIELTAQALPVARWIVNRCANRYHFAVAFLAVCRRGATNLLPPGTGAQATSELLAGYDAWLLEDDVVARAIGAGSDGARADSPPPAGVAPRIADDHLAALVFTSGSTGTPKAHEKRWRALAMSARYCRQRLGDRPLNIVVTVPPQHMYGLETSIFPLLSGDWALHDGAAFYPDEIVAALCAIPAPRLLITAPYHLRHLLASHVELPPVDLVLSATAPLTAELASEAERRLHAQVLEIYGCTEVGSMATRRTAHEEIWTPYPELSFHVIDGATIVRAAHLPAEVPIGDRVELLPDGRFRLLGRDADMLKIGGRRGSLSDIAARIATLRGVVDQVVFMPTDGETARPAALIVAPGRSADELRRELSALLDAVFVPRPLRVVASLPRNELGKLPRERLLELLVKVRNESHMTSNSTVNAPLNHPSYEGHFPGNPVVPGLLLLDLIVAALDRGNPRAVVSTKFHRVLKPGDAFELQSTSTGARTSFRCMRGSELVAEGVLEFP